MIFPTRVPLGELKLRCKEWELAGYVPRAYKQEDHPLKPQGLRVFESLDRTKPEVAAFVMWKLKEGIDYYWLVAEYAREWESGEDGVWAKQPLPADRLESASTIGLSL